MTTNEFIKTQADEISRELKARQYIADFSPESLWEIERFFKKHRDTPGDMLHAWPDNDEEKRQREKRIFSLGAYIGEVVRRNLYEWNCDDPRTCYLCLPDARSPLFPMELIDEQIKEFKEGSIAEWGKMAGLEVGECPKLPQAKFTGR
jgi:hypothetical protein